MSSPLVSVLMAAYNSENFISEAIESVLASSYKNFELIICDDKSSDNTVSIANTYKLKDNRVSVYINEKNLGDYPNRNRAASYAKGTYIKYLDHDDIIYPWGLEAMLNCMEKYPHAGFGLMSYGLVQTSSYPILNTPIEAYRNYFFKAALIGMGPSGAIFKKTAFDDVGGFSGKPFVGDSEIWLALSQKYDLVRMPNDLIWYRIHADQESKREIMDPMKAIRRFKILESALEHPQCPLPEYEKRSALRNYKNVSVRQIILRNIFSLRFRKIIFHFKNCGFTFFDFLFAFTKNKKLLFLVN